MIQKAYKYRFLPTPEQAHNLARTFGCCWFVYNWALKLRTTSYFEHGIRLYHNDLSAALTALKKEEGTAWLSEVSSVPLQQSLRHLDKAMVNFFEGRAKYPKYHKEAQETECYLCGVCVRLEWVYTYASQAERTSCYRMESPVTRMMQAK